MDNWPLILEIIGAALALASLITGLTESKEDDMWVKKLMDWFSILTHKNQSGTFKWPFK